MMPRKNIVVLKPRGFCAGVVRAIDIVRLALDVYGPPIYVRREIVHNRHVVEELRGAGAIFVEEVGEVPSGARVIFSAHGVSPAVWQQARERDLQVIDATCPLVTKVHLEARRFARQGYTILLVGHREHEEVIGTKGEAPEATEIVSTACEAEAVAIADPEKVCYVTQTTLSLDEAREIIDVLRRRFPKIQGPPAQDICYATENRQMAVKAVVSMCDLLLVVGSQNSSNSKRLVEVSRNLGVPAYLVDSFADVDSVWLDGVDRIAVTAGASAPEVLVQDMVESLSGLGYAEVQEMQLKDEDVHFSLPKELAPHSSRLTQIQMNL